MKLLTHIFHIDFQIPPHFPISLLKFRLIERESGFENIPRKISNLFRSRFWIIISQTFYRFPTLRFSFLSCGSTRFSRSLPSQWKCDFLLKSICELSGEWTERSMCLLTVIVAIAFHCVISTLIIFLVCSVDDSRLICLRTAEKNQLRTNHCSTRNFSSLEATFNSTCSCSNNSLHAFSFPFLCFKF